MITRQELFEKLRLITDFTEYKEAKEAEAPEEVFKKLVDYLYQAMLGAKRREFPDYMLRVLNSPNFKIAIVPKSQIKDSFAAAQAQYGAKGHVMDIPWPFPDVPFYVEHIFPHEFWHPYQALLRAKNQDPYAHYLHLSMLDAYRGCAPYATSDEQAECKANLNKGLERVREFRGLREAKIGTLNAREKKLLAAYTEAVSDYVPTRVSLVTLLSAFKSYGIEASNAQARLDDFLKGSAAGLSMPGGKLFIYPDSYKMDGEKLLFSGYLVPDTRDKAEAFIQDTIHRIEDLLNPSTMTAQTAELFGDKELTQLLEADAILAENSVKLNAVFYPERNAYHQRIRAKYLGTGERAKLVSAGGIEADLLAAEMLPEVGFYKPVDAEKMKADKTPPILTFPHKGGRDP